MGIDKLKTWNDVITLCKINKVQPAIVNALVEEHINKIFYEKREPRSFWNAALLQDRLNAKNETPYAAKNYIIRNHGPLVDERLYGKSTANIYWGKKDPAKSKEISTGHKLRGILGGQHKRALQTKVWKEFYTKIWSNIKKSKEFAAILKEAKFK